MTASERMEGMVEALLAAAHDRGVTSGNGDSWPRLVACTELRDNARAALLAAIGEIERDRDAHAIGADHDYQHMKDVLRDTLQRLAASQAEVARLAGVAREACDGWDRALDGVPDVVSAADRIQSLREAIPTPDPADDGECTSCGGPSCACVDDATPDPAAFVAAVDRLIESVRVHEGAGPGFGSQALDAVVKSRAALLAMGGVK